MTVAGARAIEEIAAILRGARAAVAFTGAGISTESGIPDFRSPGGIWSRYTPVQFPDFLASESERRRYWTMKAEGRPAFLSARPNAGHVALAELETRGILAALITQNIDGLHQDAGSRRVLEIHGTERWVACVECGRRYEPEPIFARFAADGAAPACDDCGGWLKSATISFGQHLPAAVLAECVELSRRADVFLAIGSSLVVHPAAALPAEAGRRGAALVIINRDPTPLDDMARHVLREPIGATLTAIVKALGES